MGKPKALIVDDEAVVRRLCGRLLAGMGYETVMTSRGLDALKMAEEQPFEVAVIDLRMPDLDGIQLLKSLRRISQRTNVVIMSAYATLENAIEALKEGASDYLRKPFSAEELQKAIQRTEIRRESAEERTPIPTRDEIYELSTGLSSAMLFEEIFNLLVNLTTQVLQTSTAVLLLLDSSSGTFYVERCKGIPEGKIKGLRIPIGRSRLGRLFTEEKPSLLEHDSEDPLFSSLSQAGGVPDHLLCVPLLTRGKILGGLLLYPRRDGSPFHPDEERTIFVMACQAALAMENARLLEGYQRRIAELTKIGDLTVLAEPQPDHSAFFTSLLQLVEGLFHYDACAFLVPSVDGGKLRIYSSLPLTDALKGDLRERMVRELGEGNPSGHNRRQDIIFALRGPRTSSPPLAEFGSLSLIPLKIKSRVHGVMAFGRMGEESFDQIAVKWARIVAHILALTLENQQLYLSVRNGSLSLVRTFSAAAELKDPHFRDHSFHTANYAKALAQKAGLPSEKVDEIVAAALLHDLGKMALPESILSKAESLSPEEFEMIKEHPAIGAKILESANLPWDLKPILMSHHERFDGGGYPGGLKGKEIPLGARILAIAEAYETMVAGRPYRGALKPAEAVQALIEGQGTHFDPQLISLFLEVLKSSEKD